MDPELYVEVGWTAAAPNGENWRVAWEGVAGDGEEWFGDKAEATAFARDMADGAADNGYSTQLVIRRRDGSIADELEGGPSIDERLDDEMPAWAAEGAPVAVRPGDVVLFGRPHGEKTRARVLRVSGKSALVETLEERGTTSVRGAGRKWRVPLDPGFLEVVESGGGDQPAAPSRRPAAPRGPAQIIPPHTHIAESDGLDWDRFAEQIVSEAPNPDWRARGRPLVQHGEQREMPVLARGEGGSEAAVGTAYAVPVLWESPETPRWQGGGFAGFALGAFEFEPGRWVLEAKPIIGQWSEKDLAGVGRQFGSMFCPRCRRPFTIKQTKKRLGPEAMLIKYRCTACGWQEEDVLD